jgi:hypothetical protein
MISTLYRRQIEVAAQNEIIDPDLVEALILIESSGNRYAWNPEPRYRYIWNVRTRKPFRALTNAEVLSKTPPSDFPCVAGDPDQEWWGQQASWGLMQIMGALARERGFVGPFLPELSDVETNLFWGCGHLGELLVWASGDIHKALAAFNAGRGGWLGAQGQAYANKVDKKLHELQQARL